jgi:hypothetical protein
MKQIFAVLNQMAKRRNALLQKDSRSRSDFGIYRERSRQCVPLTEPNGPRARSRFVSRRNEFDRIRLTNQPVFLRQFEIKH